MRTHQIHNQTGPVTSGETKPGWYSAQWLTEPVTESDGVTYYRLKDRWKGAYLHTQSGVLELGPVEPDWTSAMWAFEKSGTPGFSANGVECEVAGAWGAPGYTWAADFTGDGRADIASASGNKVTMRIKTQSRERKDGFRLETWNVAGSWGDAAYTFVGDFNNDGKADIASGYGSTMYMSISTGAAFTNEAWQAPLAWGGAGYAWVGDFDGDGFVDDIAAANGGSVSIAFSNGKGFDFRNGRIPNQWGQAGYAWAADFDRDGKTDIASANNCSVAYMRSDGLNFRLQNWKLELPKVPPCSSVLADLNSVQQYEMNRLDGASKAAEGGAAAIIRGIHCESALRVAWSAWRQYPAHLACKFHEAGANKVVFWNHL